MTLSEQAASDENHKPDGQMELAFYAFWAWTNHPDEKFVLQAWEKIVAADSISLVAWRRVVERVLCRLAPSLAAEVVRLTEAEAEYVLRLDLLQFAENQANFKLREAERKLSEIRAIATGVGLGMHQDMQRRGALKKIATLSKEPSHG